MNDLAVINYLKGLVIDGVDKANSGHPGGAMSSMDFAYILFTEFLKFHPDDPNWLGRDRFILSAGHESMLLYSLLFANGWLKKDDLAAFRQLHSRTPGHPENFLTPGVECTTGPLGQGCAMGVGMAIASQHLQAVIDPELFDQKIWVLLGDGCMQEDVTLGAASLAGHLGLSSLVFYYDRNRAQISGAIDRATSDDEETIFKGFGFRVLRVNGHDHAALRAALTLARQESEKPTLIIGDSIMAKGSKTAEGDHETHGAPLAKSDRDETKKSFGIPEGESFYWPESAHGHYQRNFANLRAAHQRWLEQYRHAVDDDHKRPQLEAFFGPQQFDSLPCPPWDRTKAQATRNSFGDILSLWADHTPVLMGGSADLEPSNMTGGFAKKVGDFQKFQRKGRNLAFGVREFPMGAVANGLALYGGFRPFTATFLTFSDYFRPAIRLGAIQKIGVIHELTHDSFYLGEDGPTHQPIEHVMSLRLMPDIYMMRPADPIETYILTKIAMSLDFPACVALTRQKMPFLEASGTERSSLIGRGAWVVHDTDNPDVIIFATGSEVHLAIDVAKHLQKRSRVVSVPCWELFFQQSESYQNDIMSWHIKTRVSIEAGSTLGWERFVGPFGIKIGIDHYGHSAPADALAEEFGFTKEKIVQKIIEQKG